MNIPSHLLGGLERYRDYGIRPGSFLTAVLKNDLNGAIKYGDPEAVQALRSIVQWCDKELPYNTYGNSEAVNSHIESKAKT